MTRPGNVLVLTVGVGLLVSACSGSDAAPATTAVSTSVATTIESPTTTSSTTTEAPTTALDPTTALAAEVEADFLEADRLGREASQDPFNSDKEVAALDRRLGVVRENFAAKLADYRTRNYAIRPNPETPASMTVEVPAALVVEGGDVAELQLCEVDSWILVEVGAGPDGSDAIVSPDVYSYRSTVFMRSVSGLWKFEGGNEVGRWEGDAGCPAD